MMKEQARDYYLNQGYNCAESVLLAASDTYHLNLKPEDIRLVSGFGAGMGCGETCGALCGAVAALGALLVKTNAHQTPDFMKKSGALVQAFEQEMGTLLCREIKEKNFRPDVRCVETVEQAADLFASYYEKING